MHWENGFLLPSKERGVRPVGSVDKMLDRRTPEQWQAVLGFGQAVHILKFCDTEAEAMEAVEAAYLESRLPD